MCENLVAEPLVWQAVRDTLLAGSLGSVSHALHGERSSLLWMGDNGHGGGGRNSLSDVFIQTQPKKVCWLERAQYQREKAALRTKGLIGGRG